MYSMNYNDQEVCVDTGGVLSVREEQILGLDALGKTDDQKADITGCATGTIIKHKASIRKKLNTISTCQSVGHAFLSGYITSRNMAIAIAFSITVSLADGQQEIPIRRPAASAAARPAQREVAHLSLDDTKGDHV